MASHAEIAVQMKRLTDTMPPPRGVNSVQALPGYLTALTPFSVDEVRQAIDRYLTGEFDGVSLKFYPRAPELASLCRRVRQGAQAAYDADRRREEIARQRAERAEADRVIASRTPEEKARVQALYQKFLKSNHAARLTDHVGRPIGRRSQPLGDPRANLNAMGITDEMLAKIPDRPLPSGMKSLSDALPPSVSQPPSKENKK
ncbi:MAG: hypothetical protein QM744_14495 [Mesorhizobium sp.]